MLTNTEMSNSSSIRRERIILFLLISQSVCILLITIFCIWVTVYGYPLLNGGGADKLKSSLLLEVRGFLTDEVGTLAGHMTEGFDKSINNFMVALTEAVQAYLEPYESLKTINVGELNEAIKKVNRLPF